jgi:hypothetical protein
MLTACVAAILLATGLVVGTGCGKSSSSTGTTANAVTGTSQTTATDIAGTDAASGKALTHDELVAEANTICKGIVAQQAVVNKGSKAQPALTRRVIALAAYDQGALSALSRLRPPASMEGEWQPVAALATSFAAEMAKFSNALKENRVKFGFSQLFPLVTAVERKLIAATLRIGLKECAAI